MAGNKMGHPWQMSRGATVVAAVVETVAHYLTQQVLEWAAVAEGSWQPWSWLPDCCGSGGGSHGIAPVDMTGD